MSFQVIDPESLGAPRGWSHGMLAPAAGRLLFVAGQTATDASGRVVPGPIEAQWARALERIVEVVREAGGGPEHIGRLTIYVTDRAEYLANLGPIGRAYREVMGRHYPAIALVEVSGLVDEGASVEIEATAVIPERSGA